MFPGSYISDMVIFWHIYLLN